MTGNATRNASDLWVRRYHPAPDARATLICLPHAGGSASYYYPVSRSLAPGVDTLAIQYPGRQDRRTEKCVESVHELADEVVKAILPFTSQRFALFGHSMGASVGYEVASRLEAKGIVPDVLFASGRRAPSRVRDERDHLLTDDGLIAQIKKLSGTDAKLLDDDEVLRMTLPSIRNDYRAAETYRPADDARPLSCRIVALVGDNDPKVTVDEAESWSAHTTGTSTLKVFPGGHFYLNTCSEAVIGLVAAQLS
jgi:pyochelin biosynthesis protein PchC